MKYAPGHSKLPVLFLTGSFFTLALTALLTRPVDKLGYAILFFAALLVFFISLGYLLARLQLGGVSNRSRSRITIISTSLVILLMFRSAQSLGLIDTLVLILITIGLLFYIGRRTPNN